MKKSATHTYYMIDRHGSYRKIEALNDTEALMIAKEKDPQYKQLGTLGRQSPVKQKVKGDIYISPEEFMTLVVAASFNRKEK